MMITFNESVERWVDADGNPSRMLDEFAMAALPEMLRVAMKSASPIHVDEVASDAYAMADAMMRFRFKKI